MFDLPLIRRNDPTTARFQSWSVPVPADDAEKLLAGAAAMDGPQPGEWWMITVTDPGNTTVYGDVAVHLNDSSSAAEIGCTFDPGHRGRGLATEATRAVVDALWGSHPGLRRVQATMHPDNMASARVVERLGFVFEGRTRLSYYRDDRLSGGDEECSDDLIYGLTRGDWIEWWARPIDRPAQVELVEITARNQRAVRALAVHHSQDHLVAPVLESLADAQFPPVVDGYRVKPWMRAMYADAEPAGFVLMAEPAPIPPEPYLWRFLVDRRHQGRGIGAAAMTEIVK
jgi:RimJ/RimL family protein N-acetyltransferase